MQSVTCIFMFSIPSNMINVTGLYDRLFWRHDFLEVFGVIWFTIDSSIAYQKENKSKTKRNETKQNKTKTETKRLNAIVD